MSSEAEISDYSQTSREPEKEEVEEEEDDNVQVIFSQIEPYQEELLAEDDSTAEGNKVDERARRRRSDTYRTGSQIQKRFLSIHGSYNCGFISYY